MRILILGLNFSPELVGIGKYTGDLADYLAQAGLDLHVVTTPPYYPEWKIGEGYSGCSYRQEGRGKIQIFRCPLWVPKRVSNLKRLLHLLSFSISSFPVMLAQTAWKPNLILCIVPALLSAPNAWLIARLCGAKCWLHIQDFELDVALNLGMLPGILSLARGFERFILTRFDRVSTISERMLARAIQKGVAPGKTLLFPNWVDTSQVFPLQGINPLRAELGIAQGQKVILYHGNLGRKQGLDILIEAAAYLQDRPEILFLISGTGAARSELEQKASGLKNVRLVDLQPLEKLNLLVNLADVHVLPQRASAEDLVMPSKLTTMLASGKPVLACAHPNTQLWNIVNKVGKTVPPEDAQALAQSILSLVMNPSESESLGRSGREFACSFLEKGAVLSEFIVTMEKLIGRNG